MWEIMNGCISKRKKGWWLMGYLVKKLIRQINE